MSPNAPPIPLTVTSIAAPYPAPIPQPGSRLTLLLLNTDSVKMPKNNAQTGPLVPVVCKISVVVNNASLLFSFNGPAKASCTKIHCVTNAIDPVILTYGLLSSPNNFVVSANTNNKANPVTTFSTEITGPHVAS